MKAYHAVNKMTKCLNEQAEAFLTRPPDDEEYQVLWTTVPFEKVRFDGRAVSRTILLVCGVNLEGLRKVIIEPILEESCQTCRQMFGKLKERGLKMPALVISDAPSGLAAAIRKRFHGACRQRCKAHFMRNIFAHIPKEWKDSFAKESRRFGLLPPRREQENERPRCVGSTPRAIPKRSRHWRTAWRTL